MTARRVYYVPDEIPERTASRMLGLSPAQLREEVPHRDVDRWGHRIYWGYDLLEYAEEHQIEVPIVWTLEAIAAEIGAWARSALVEASPLGVAEEFWCMPVVELADGSLVSVQARATVDVVPHSELPVEPVAPVVPLVQLEEPS